MGLSSADVAALASWQRELRRPALLHLCPRCEGEVSADDEVQCHFCGEFHCCECDLEHSCASTNTCTKCNKRFANADLALPTCECDEELCKPCLKAHLCPPTVSQGVNALSDDLAESLVR